MRTTGLEEIFLRDNSYREDDRGGLFVFRKRKILKFQNDIQRAVIVLAHGRRPRIANGGGYSNGRPTEPARSACRVANRRSIAAHSIRYRTRLPLNAWHVIGYVVVVVGNSASYSARPRLGARERWLLDRGNDASTQRIHVQHVDVDRYAGRVARA